MAIVGDVLLNPEPGWKRITDRDPNIIYSVPWGKREPYGSYAATLNASGKFKFIGTKVRVIGGVPDGQYGIITIYIDGIAYPVNTNRPWKTVLVEIIGMENKEHTIYFVDTSGSYVEIDAFDVDESSSTIDWYSSMTKSSISQMKIGDRIPFHYKSTLNAFGTIDQLGSSISPEIPVSGTATPDGTAYFIHSGYDSQGKMKLIPDRNIQFGIGYDTLNTAGVASGSGLPISIDGNNGYTLRLLSGGTSATDLDNEWDKIVAGSTLGGTVIAGENAVWNWQTVWSWVSTRHDASTVVVRGYTASTGISNCISNQTSGTSSGFRPVLLVDPVNSICTINKVTPTHLYAWQHTTCELNAGAILDNVNVAFKVSVNGVDVSPLGIDAIRIIPITSFIVGSNTVNVIAADGGSKTVTVILEAPYRLSVERTFKDYDGGYIVKVV